MASEKWTECHSSLEDDCESHLPSSRLLSRNHGCHRRRAPSLSIDSGTFSVEPCQVFESSEDFRSDSRTLCDCADTNCFTEEELLNITFEACDTTGKGEVQASTVVQYLQSMTLQNSGQDKLKNLQRMLDPENRNDPVSRDRFHATMRDWIAQCCQDGLPEDKNQVPGSVFRKLSLTGTEYPTSLNEATFTDGAECHCETGDLLGLVAELKHNQQRLSEQNSSLLRTVSQCEDTILQLNLEVSELHTKLASAQLFAVRSRALSEELDETRSALQESQDRATRAQASNRALIKESDRLKALIKISEEKNVKITMERNLSEERINKLKREISDLRSELEETYMVLAVKDRDLTKRNILLEKLKYTHFESHKLIEGIQSELMRLQEHSQQALFRLNKSHSGSPGSQRTCATNHQSLDCEIQEAQPNVTMELSSSLSQMLPIQREDIQNIKPVELSHILHLQFAETDGGGGHGAAEMLERQQQHESSRNQLMTLLNELDLLKAPRTEQGKMLTKSRHQTPEAQIAAAITWCRGQGKQCKKSQTGRDPHETVRVVHQQTPSLEVDQKTAHLEEKNCGVSVVRETRTFRDAQVQAEETWKKEFRDVAVLTDSLVDVGEMEGLLKALRRVEDMVTQASQVLMDGEKKIKERIESIIQRMEKAPNIATTTEHQLNALEVSINTQLSLSDGRSVAVDLTPVDITSLFKQQPVAQENLASLRSVKGGSLLYTRAEDHSNKVSENSDESSSGQDPGSPSDLWLSRIRSSELVTADLSPQTSALTCIESGSYVEHSPHHTQENVAGSVFTFLYFLKDKAFVCLCKILTQRPSDGRSDPSASNESFPSTSEDSENTLATQEEPCRSQSLIKEDSICSETEQPNGKGQTESWTSEYSDRKEVLKLLNQGRPFKSENGCDNQTFDSSRLCQAELEDTGKCQERSEEIHEESDCSGRSQEESEGSGESQARTQISEEPKTSDSDTSKYQGLQSSHHSDSPGDRVNNSTVCQTKYGQSEQTLLKRAHSVTTEAVSPFVFPHTRSRSPLTPTMPTLPEEEEDSPEELDSEASSPTTYAPVESKVVNVTMSPPAIVLPTQASKQELCVLEKARPHSPRPRLSRNSATSVPITTVDDEGHVIDLVKDQLPELQLSEEERRKNLELLEEAKKVSDRFLQRRGRRSTSSLTDSPTALSPNPTPSSSPRPSRSSSLSAPVQLGGPEVSTPPASPSFNPHLEVPSSHDRGDTSRGEQESFSRVVEWKPSEKRKVSSGALNPRHATTIMVRDPAVAQKENPDRHGSADKTKNSEHAGQKKDEISCRGANQPLATGVAKPVPRPPTQQAPCTAEIKTIGAFPPLMRAVSWDTVGSVNMRNAAPKGEENLTSDKSLFKSSGYKDFPVPPGNVQKLSKLREEHKLIRIQTISSSKLPDLNESTEQSRGPPSPLPSSPSEDDVNEKHDAMPNISDVMLRKLKLHRGLPGCAPPLSEKEVENAFVQLSLAFRNDNYTLESRLKQAERERNLTEENTEKELEEFKCAIKSTVSLWQNAEQREFYQQLIETISVFHRLTNRLSSRAEMVGAVRQEKRMNKATEVMMQYVENLKRTYEKDHAELMEFKKLANQNSNRCYSGSVDTGDDGVQRPRFIPPQLGKALPRRRVSVAVVPKFNLLNVPGQTSAVSSALPVLCEANTIRNCNSSDSTHQDVHERNNGNRLPEQEGEAMPSRVHCNPEKITDEIKAKLEEEAYNKGYQEGLKRSKELKEDEEKAEEKQLESEEEIRGGADENKKPNSRYEEALEFMDRIFPKVFRRNRLLWIVITVFLVLFLFVNIMNFFSHRYSDSGDTSAEKSAIPGKKKFFGLNVGSKSPAPE
ncbi:uncharacterized protein [Misgurnus anguillicaudatus]|uniref:uncharacterized protein isoform X1 n=1 Tax=Misgurnus anguillicaudatus TaxID=75329 RepID=UPI003CCF69BE